MRPGSRNCHPKVEASEPQRECLCTRKYLLANALDLHAILSHSDVRRKKKGREGQKELENKPLWTRNTWKCPEVHKTGQDQMLRFPLSAALKSDRLFPTSLPSSRLISLSPW